MWPFARHWVFEPPPCICDEIEARVRDACAMRDEIAAWDTPLEEWKKLQQMTVLQPKAKPQPYVDTWGDIYRQVMNGTYFSTSTAQPFRYLP